MNISNKVRKFLLISFLAVTSHLSLKADLYVETSVQVFHAALDKDINAFRSSMNQLIAHGFSHEGEKKIKLSTIVLNSAIKTQVDKIEKGRGSSANVDFLHSALQFVSEQGLRDTLRSIDEKSYYDRAIVIVTPVIIAPVASMDDVQQELSVQGSAIPEARRAPEISVDQVTVDSEVPQTSRLANIGKVTAGTAGFAALIYGAHQAGLDKVVVSGIKSAVSGFNKKSVLSRIGSLFKK